SRKRKVRFLKTIPPCHLGIIEGWGGRQNILIHMEMDKVKDSFKEVATALLPLYFNQWIAAIGQQFTFAGKGLLDELSPGSTREMEAQRQCVEEKTKDMLTTGRFGASMRDQTCDDIGLTTQELQNPEMTCQQTTFKRNSQSARELLQPGGDLLNDRYWHKQG